jgi:hypothetical protein
MNLLNSDIKKRLRQDLEKLISAGTEKEKSKIAWRLYMFCVKILRGDTLALDGISDDLAKAIDIVTDEFCEYDLYYGDAARYRGYVYSDEAIETFRRGKKRLNEKIAVLRKLLKDDGLDKKRLQSIGVTVKLKERGLELFSALQKGVNKDVVSDVERYLCQVLKAARDNKISHYEMALFFGYFIAFDGLDDELQDIVCEGAAVDAFIRQPLRFRETVHDLMRRLSGRIAASTPG